MKPRYRLALALGSVLLVTLLLSSWLFRSDDPKDLTLDQFQSELDHGNVKTAELKDRDNEVKGELRDGTHYSAIYPQEYADELTADISKAEPPVELSVDQQHDPFWLSLLASLLPIVLLVGVFLFVMSQMQGGGGKVMKFGRARAKKVDKDQPSVTFADVAGADEAVEELQEIKDFLRAPAKFQALGAKIPKGVLLYGPPGTGKTLLARAVAGEADAPFFSISGSDFVEMFVGVGASRVRDLFEQAKAAAPAIVFVDEIDAVGRHRGAGLGGGHDEREQTLNQLLVEMDGFDVAGGVILIAATNRPDILDPALLRPGRFDRQIVVDLPDLVGRRAILEVHAKGKPLGDDIDLDVVARRTPGFTGADLANLMNEAALMSARRQNERIDMATLGDAMDRVIAGAERKSRVMSDKEKQVIAYHESGHALVGHVLPNTDPIHKVSIIARGRALGWTLALPTEDKYLKTSSELRDQLAMLLGGRTAEELIFGDPTTGASDDIERATQIAMAMVTEFGMSEALGLRRLGQRNQEVFLGKEVGHEPNYSEQVATDIDAEVRRLIDAAHDEAAEILTLHRATLDRMAESLIANETLDEDMLNELFAELDTWDGGGTGRVSGPSAPGPTVDGAERVRATNLEPGDGKGRRWWRP